MPALRTPDTILHLRDAVESLARSRKQTTGVLAALAATSALYPAAGLCAMALGAGLLAVRTVVASSRSQARPLTWDGIKETLGLSKTPPTTEPRSHVLGKDAEGRPIRFSDDELRRHMLVLGTSGSGKTEILLGMLESMIRDGTGGVIVDGKGDVSLIAKMHAIATNAGREDDLLFLNMTTTPARLGEDDPLRSNTLNPFSSGNHDVLAQMVVGLMDDTSFEGAVWRGRAAAMFTGLMGALVWMRDEKGLDLTVKEVRDRIGFARIVDLADPEAYPDMPGHVRAGLQAYLNVLPGYNPERGANQAQTALQQHGYFEMQFASILGSLGEVYSHAFGSPIADIDMEDVVRNRRILVVVMPALQKSDAETANLGKIVAATLKAMMGSALGARIEGTWDEAISAPPTERGKIFPCVLDDVGHYTVEGLSLMAAQARSLGFSMIYASPDIPSLRRLNEKEAAGIVANTATKMFLRTEDVERSAELARQAGLRDLRSLKAGQMVILRDGKTSLGTLGYGGATPTPTLPPRANRFVTLGAPKHAR